MRSCLLSAAPAETQVVLRVYKYDLQSMLYSIDGLTSLLKANCLKCNVTEYITLQNDLISFNTEACTDLIEYVPYHSDITLSDDAFTEDTKVADDDSDEYIVEEVINRRFNGKEGRFEYQVKWKGYSHI